MRPGRFLVPVCLLAHFGAASVDGFSFWCLLGMGGPSRSPSYYDGNPERIKSVPAEASGKVNSPSELIPGEYVWLKLKGREGDYYVQGWVTGVTGRTISFRHLVYRKATLSEEGPPILEEDVPILPIFETTSYRAADVIEITSVTRQFQSWVQSGRPVEIVYERAWLMPASIPTTRVPGTLIVQNGHYRVREEDGRTTPVEEFNWRFQVNPL